MFVFPHHRRAPSGSVPITDGLVSWWQFDEGSGLIVGDSVGGHDGSLVAMDDNNWQLGPGGVGHSLEFTDNSQYVSVPTDPDFDFPTTSPDGLTLFVHCYPLLNPIVRTVPLSRYWSSYRSPWMIGYGQNTDNKKFMLGGYNFTGPLSTNEYEYANWYRVAGTIQDSTGIICVNGDISPSAGTGSYGLATKNDITFGRVYWNSTSSGFLGRIAEIRIYDRKLSSAELIALTTGVG